MINKHSCYLLFLFVFPGCHTNERITNDKEKSLIEQNIRQTRYDYYQDIKEHGLTAEFKYLDSSSAFYGVPPDSPLALGYDSIRTMIGQNADKFKSVDIDGIVCIFSFWIKTTLRIRVNLNQK
jgi:hypothetical protein